MGYPPPTTVSPQLFIASNVALRNKPAHDVRLMKPAQFRAAAKRVVGDGRGWQSAIARELGVHRSTVCRWLKGGVIPALVQKHLAIKQGGKYGEERDA